MKRAAIALALLFSLSLGAQTVWDSIPSRWVKFNPFSWFHPTLGYERQLAPHHAVELTAGGAPQMRFLPGGHHVGIFGGTLVYRLYPFYFSESLHMPYLQVGGGWLLASGHYDVQDYNDGWDIHTRTYRYRSGLLFPCIGGGVRWASPISHSSLEVGLTLPLGRRWHGGHDGGELMKDAKATFILTQLLNIKIGYAF